jgi:hypothetical protein
MRKMLLTGALVLFGAGTTQQVVAAITVCILWSALIANLKPFGEDVDDRLAQVEALQVLFTLLVALVLQLEAASDEDSGGMDETNLAVVLIGLNSLVVGLALIQQPIVITIGARLASIPRHIAAKCRRTRDWEKAWIVAPSDEEYRSFLRRGAPEQSGVGALFEVWCDAAMHPPRVLSVAPIALAAQRPDLEARAWNFDREGNVLANPRPMMDVENGLTRWIDLDTMRVLNAPPIELFETTSVGSAVQWLDTEMQALLHAPPGLLVFKEPEQPEGSTAHPNDVVWKHRNDGRLVSVAPTSGRSTEGVEPRASEDEWTFAAVGATRALPLKMETNAMWISTAVGAETTAVPQQSEADTRASRHLNRSASFKERSQASKDVREKRILGRKARREMRAHASSALLRSRLPADDAPAEIIEMTVNPFSGKSDAFATAVPQQSEADTRASRHLTRSASFKERSQASKDAREKRILGRKAKREMRAHASSALLRTRLPADDAPAENIEMTVNPFSSEAKAAAAAVVESSAASTSASTSANENSY